MKRSRCGVILVLLLMPLSAAATKLAAEQSSGVPLSFLWEAPSDLHARDLFYGPWGQKYAPDPQGVYTFLRSKGKGVNPGVIVKDSRGRVWHVKQAGSSGRGDEGPAEVVISRVLSALGYHQPPVYYMPSFKMIDDRGSHLEAGGRFRVDDPTLVDRGSWSLRNNPFVGTQPYRGLLVILMMFNSWDLKDSNNTLYEVRGGPQLTQWYVIRDLGGAMGSTGTLTVKRNNIEKFEEHGWIRNVSNGVVRFDYSGKEPELFRDISVQDVRWASDLVGGLTDRQWSDAFRAGGYSNDLARRFIQKLRGKIEEGRRLATH
jgi:hypothetical protein